jgi:integrase
MQTDKSTRKKLKELGLTQEKNKPGWKIRIKNFEDKWQKFGLGTTDMDEAIKEAQEAKDDFVGWLAKRKTSTATLKAGVSWESATAEYIKDVDGRREGLSVASRQNIENVLKYFRLFVGNKDPLKITRTDLQRYHDDLVGSRRVVLTSSDTYVSRLLGFFNFLKAKHFAASLFHLGAPLKIIRVRGEKRARKVYCTMPKIQQLIQGCPDDKMGKKLKFILFAGFFAGMRKGEISYCRPEWIDLEKKQITIPKFDPISGFRPKDRTTRWIPIFDDFYNFLTKEWTDWKRQKFVVSGRGKKEASGVMRYDFRKIFAAHRRLFGMNRVTIHTMRHSFVTVCLENKASLEMLSLWTSDSIEVLNAHYHHFTAQNVLPESQYMKMREENAA